MSKVARFPAICAAGPSSPIPPSVNPQLTAARQTVESRLNRNELSGVPTARIRRWNNGHNLSRKQSEKDLTTDDTDRTDKRSEMPFIRVVSEISGCSFLRPGSWPDASQGAGRTISGYDILPRIQGHAHAKPWAWHPASQVARFPAICAAGPRHFAFTRSKFMMKAWDQGTQFCRRLLRASIFSLPRRGRPRNLGLTGMN